MKFAEAEPAEYALVFDSWARSFYKSPYAGCVPNHLYAQTQRTTIGEILDRGARVLVMYVESEQGRRVAGYSVSEPSKGLLHWLFVKKHYRGFGYGRQLLEQTRAAFRGDELRYTHRTRSSTRFLGDGWHWMPELARMKG